MGVSQVFNLSREHSTKNCNDVGGHRAVCWLRGKPGVRIDSVAIVALRVSRRDFFGHRNVENGRLHAPIDLANGVIAG